MNNTTSFWKNRIKHITSDVFQPLPPSDHWRLTYMYVEGLLKGLTLENTDVDHWPLKITQTIIQSDIALLEIHSLEIFVVGTQVPFWCLTLGQALNIPNFYYSTMLPLELRPSHCPTMKVSHKQEGKSDRVGRGGEMAYSWVGQAWGSGWGFLTFILWLIGITGVGRGKEGIENGNQWSKEQEDGKKQLWQRLVICFMDWSWSRYKIKSTWDRL